MSEKYSLHEFGVTPEQIVGYVYAGLSATLCFAFVNPAEVKVLTESLGSCLSLLVVLGLGIGIYTFYFKFLGELVLWPLTHFSHDLVDRIRGLKGKSSTSVTGYLQYLGVDAGCRRIAYETVKSSFYKIEERRRIQLAHGELHVLYLTAIEILVTSVFLNVYGSNRFRYFLITGFILYFVSLILDIRQHTCEAFKLRSYDKDALVKFIKDEGFIVKN